MSEEVDLLFEKTFGRMPTSAAFAPGRIEFIGNHTDYNGGLVMGAAVKEGISVAVRLRQDRLIRVVSDSGALVDVGLDQMIPQHGAASWVNYPLGVVKVMVEAGMNLSNGFEMAVASTLPAGAGMSSSAAFELASAHALARLFRFETDKVGFARIGRKAENEFVGVPCGILDQGVSAFGEADHLVRIDCAREAFSVIGMPKGTHFWIFNSNKKHSLVDSHYSDRYEECLGAKKALSQRLGSLEFLSEVTIEDLDLNLDCLDAVQLKRARHIVTENARVKLVESALASGDLETVGGALKASHNSSRNDFENSIPELDFLVETVSKQDHVYGARLTGGGFGGAIMAFTDEAFSRKQAEEVAIAYKEKFALDSTIIHTRAGDGAHVLY